MLSVIECIDYLLKRSILLQLIAAQSNEQKQSDRYKTTKQCFKTTTGKLFNSDNISRYKCITPYKDSIDFSTKHITGGRKNLKKNFFFLMIGFMHGQVLRLEKRDSIRDHQQDNNNKNNI